MAKPLLSSIILDHVLCSSGDKGRIRGGPDAIRFRSSEIRPSHLLRSLRLPRCGIPISYVSTASAREITKEAHAPAMTNDRASSTEKFSGRIHHHHKRMGNTTSRHNPLLRQEMMSCGWLAVIVEFEVLVEDNPDHERQAWLSLSQEEGRSPPPAFVLRRMEGMKSEQAMSEVLCWSRDSVQLKRMACRKSEIYGTLHGEIQRARVRSIDFLAVLTQYKIPTALVSTQPRKAVQTAIEMVGAKEFIDVIVAGEDVLRGKPDPEMFVYAAQLLGYMPSRCVVIGTSNGSVEAAHDGRMKCVAVATRHAGYHLSSADMVVHHLDELSIVDLKKLIEDQVDESRIPELQMKKEALYSSCTSVSQPRLFF